MRRARPWLQWPYTYRKVSHLEAPPEPPRVVDKKDDLELSCANAGNRFHTGEYVVGALVDNNVRKLSEYGRLNLTDGSLVGTLTCIY